MAELVSPEGLREDGRRAGEVRLLLLLPWLPKQLTRVCGNPCVPVARRLRSCGR